MHFPLASGLVGPLVWLGLFCLAGGLVNKIMKRPALNAAQVFIWVAVAMMIASVVPLLDPTAGGTGEGNFAYLLGQRVGGWILSILLAHHISRRFRSRQIELARPASRNKK